MHNIDTTALGTLRNDVNAMCDAMRRNVDILHNDCVTLFCGHADYADWSRAVRLTQAYAQQTQRLHDYLVVQQKHYVAQQAMCDSGHAHLLSRQHSIATFGPHDKPQP
jgi:hypothetical protein